MVGSISGIMAVCLLSTLASATSENVRVFTIENATRSEVHDSDTPVMVMVDFQQAINSIGPYYVGVTIDASMVRLNWSTLDFSSKKVQNMAKALSPTYFRLGGTTADAMTYDFGNEHRSEPTVQDAPFNMSAQQWDAVNNFAHTVGWDFIMDLNALKRNADGSWNPSNARQLLQYSAKRNYTIVGFELGNEYDIYKSKYNTTLSPAQLAKDVASLQKVLAEFPNYYSAFIVGPEAASGVGDHFAGFLSAGGAQVVRAASFHQYYFPGSEGKVSWFTDIQRMDSLAHELDSVMMESRIVDPQLPVWLSETSSSYNSGTVNVSDRFVAGFLWLDKLGVCAVKGVQTVIRQDFYGGHYALTDEYLNPNPDFWLTVLYKRIVRGAVFKATGRSDVRVYSACANKDNFKPGSLVVYMLNPNNYSVTFDLPQLESQPRLIYALTAGDKEGLVSKFTSLNGVKLELVNDDLPKLEPKMVSSGSVTMSPYSFIFVVFPEARVSICMEQQ